MRPKGLLTWCPATHHAWDLLGHSSGASSPRRLLQAAAWDPMAAAFLHQTAFLHTSFAGRAGMPWRTAGALLARAASPPCGTSRRRRTARPRTRTATARSALTGPLELGADGRSPRLSPAANAAVPGFSLRPSRSSQAAPPPPSSGGARPAAPATLLPRAPLPPPCSEAAPSGAGPLARPGGGPPCGGPRRPRLGQVGDHAMQHVPAVEGLPDRAPHLAGRGAAGSRAGPATALPAARLPSGVHAHLRRVIRTRGGRRRLGRLRGRTPRARGR